MTKVSRNLQFAILFVLCYSCTFISVLDGRNITHSKLPKNDQTSRSLSIRAVNLGGWLVTEGWIKPSLFYGIPNKDFLDGTQLQFKSVSIKKYLTAESGGGNIVVANRTSASGWETFTLWRVRETIFYLRVFNKQFMGMNSDGIIVASENTPALSQEFQIVRNPDDPTQVRIMAPNGRYIQVKTEELITADSMGDAGWGDDDPSIFEMNLSIKLQGEFQVTNGHGPVKAQQVMREHWNTFIVEDDFKFIARNGLNAVRIPVGWWIASDPSPPEPYISGSLETLDKAFLWARKYGIKVIIDLHAAPGSQNPWEHSSSRDGSQEWGKTDENIQQTVAVIEFLTARYAMNPSLYAVELINEPLAPGVSLETIKKYYKAGYDVVRKHSPTAYVVMCNRLNISNQTELIYFASGLKGSVIDVHYYNLFTTQFDDLTVDQNIDFIRSNRSTQLSEVTTSNGPLTFVGNHFSNSNFKLNGPLAFVGEWVAEWQVKDAVKEDYQRFGKAQLEVYGRATFGWAYWTFKNVEKHWSLEWMIKNDYIKLR